MEEEAWQPDPMALEMIVSGIQDLEKLEEWAETHGLQQHPIIIERRNSLLIESLDFLNDVSPDDNHMNTLETEELSEWCVDNFELPSSKRPPSEAGEWDSPPVKINKLSYTGSPIPDQLGADPPSEETNHDVSTDILFCFIYNLLNN